MVGDTVSRLHQGHLVGARSDAGIVFLGEDNLPANSPSFRDPHSCPKASLGSERKSISHSRLSWGAFQLSNGVISWVTDETEQRQKDRGNWNTREKYTVSFQSFITHVFLKIPLTAQHHEMSETKGLVMSNSKNLGYATGWERTYPSGKGGTFLENSKLAR